MNLSEQVKACQDVTRSIVPLLKDRATRTGEALSAVFNPFLGGAAVPSGEALLLLAAAAISAQQTRLEETDVAHSRELSDDGELRDKRDAVTLALYDEMIRLRVAIEASFGDTGIRALAMNGVTPRDAPRLQRLAEDVAGRLLMSDVSLGAPKSRISFDRERAGDDIAALAASLKGCIEAVDREVAQAKATQEARAKALAEWYDRVPKLCALARGILLAAGDEEGAAWVVSTPNYHAPKSEKAPKPDESAAAAPAAATEAPDQPKAA
jgi:hypothetical protein